MMVGLYYGILGFGMDLGFSEYHVYLFGALIFALPTLVTEMGPSFVLQRTPMVIEDKKMDLLKFFRELKEAFLVVRHNKYIVLEIAAKTITSFTPHISEYDFLRFGNVRFGKMSVESLMFLRDNIFSVPGTLIVPFSLPIIKKVGGPREAKILYRLVSIIALALRAIVGMKSTFGIIFAQFMWMAIHIMGKPDEIARGIIRYEMLDYVEWKTGRRSEGMTIAVTGVLERLILDNVNLVVGNLIIDAIGFDSELKDNQPASFFKWAPIFYLITPIFDNIVILIARLLYKYPASQRDMVEADLIERRRLALEMEEGLEENTI